MTDAELENRYSYHAPFGDQAERYGRIRAKVLETAKLIRDLCPDSRERATALTQLDFAMMMANAAIARHETPSANPLTVSSTFRVGMRVRIKVGPHAGSGVVTEVDPTRNPRCVMVRGEWMTFPLMYRPDELEIVPEPVPAHPPAEPPAGGWPEVAPPPNPGDECRSSAKSL